MAAVERADPLEQHEVLPCGSFVPPPSEVKPSSVHAATLHAKIYVLADRYCATELQTYALAKLHATLYHAFPNQDSSTVPQTRNAILDLIEYAYSAPIPSIPAVGHGQNGQPVEGTKEHKEWETNMRSLVAFFTACNIETFMAEPRFIDMLMKHHELAVNVLMWEHKDIHTKA